MFKSKNLKLFIFILLFFISLISVLLTFNDYGLTWDEPSYFDASKSYLNWMLDLRKIKKISFSKTEIDKYWNINKEHPPLAKIIMGITGKIFKEALGEINAFRLSSAIFFSLIIGLLFIFGGKYYNSITGLIASISFLFLPRLFGHSHFAGLDLPTAFFWFLGVYAFLKGQEDKNWSIIWGVILGLGFATRFVLFVLPFILFFWAIIFSRKNIKFHLLSLLIISPLVFFLFNPYLWINPLEHFKEYLQINLYRSQWNRVPLYYLGKQYISLFPYKKSLYYPWHYPYLMTLWTVPASILVLSIIGKVYVLIKRDKIGVLIILNLITPLLILTPPQVPKYDGVRLFLPAFVFLAILTGIGFFSIIELINNKIRDKIRYFLLIFFSIFMLYFAVTPLIKIHPFELGYYNEFTGGVWGAGEKGMETTYWGEMVNYKVLSYLNQNLDKKAKVLFTPFPEYILDYYQEKGFLRSDLICKGLSSVDINSLEKTDYLVLISRQGCFSPEAWWVYKNLKPVYSIVYDEVYFVSVYPVRKYFILQSRRNKIE